MKKILHILCAALLTISMFHVQVFQPSEARANTYVKDAIFAALKWMPVGYGRDGQQLRNNALFPWQRGSEEIWGNRQYLMPSAGAPRPATSGTKSTPVYYTEVYFDVIAAGGRSTEANHYFVVLDDSNQIWFDKDGRFQDARQSDQPSTNCRTSSGRVDPSSANNTMGPYRIGEYLHIENDKGYMFTPSGATEPIEHSDVDFSGRVFKIGQALLGNEENHPVLLISEVLQASCGTYTYNISVESDLWMGTNPAVTSARLLSRHDDVPEVAQLIQKSTVLDPSGREFFAPATTFHNIRLKYREYIGVEIWKDNGVNVNEFGGNTRSNNLSDDYKAGETCEEFLGMKQGTSDTDAYLFLTPIPVTDRFYSSTGSTRYGCQGPIYRDFDDSHTVSTGDLRVTSIHVNMGETIINYGAGTTVAEGDSDVGFPLQDFIVEDYYDANENDEFDAQDFIYRDNDANDRVTAGDLRLSLVNYRGTTYECGSTVQIGDIWLFENPVTGITMGKNGNFRCMDMEVIPGQMEVSVSMNPAFRVEQTTTVTVAIQPPLANGEKAVILIRSAEGGDSIREVNPGVRDYTFTYTPWEGTCSPLGKQVPITVELYRGQNFTDVNQGPKDGNYGYWKVDTPRSVYALEDKYDCRMFKSISVQPESLKFRTNIACLSNISFRYPNLVLKIFDDDNKSDVNDPNGMAVSSTPGRNILANYNATGSGIRYMFTAIDQMNNKYIVQVNRDNTYLLWKWIDNPSPTPGKGFYGALDFEDEVSGPYDSVNGQALYGGSLEDKDCSEDKIECQTCELSGLPPLGKITKGDTFGIFDGTLGEILNDGIWVFVTPYGKGLIGNDGGEFPVCLWPREENNDISVRVFTPKAMYDYNSTISHPPYFVTGGGDGIDYCGIALLGWKSSDPNPPPPDPDPPNPDPPDNGGRNDGIAFSEFVAIDHSLQYSEFRYSDSIHPDYDPVLQHMIRDFRCYPGGQTHTGRSGPIIREGRNACPANWENQFVKLGTEFFPMTDYGIYFVLRDSNDGGLLSFESSSRSHRITQIEIQGPFITPHFPLSNVRYGGSSNVPLTYDWDGEIVIDSSNYKEYELSGADWTRTTNPGMRESVRYGRSNSVLEYSRRLNYTGIPKVIVIDELIPVQYGKISIRVHLADGRVGDYFDCCDVPMEGIPVHALDIGDYSGGIEYGKDCEFTATILEHSTIQSVRQVNDAVVFIWQDRGVKSRYNQETLEGAGDGWVTMAPESSENSGYSTAYSSSDDLNDDGKISFNDFETEIIGSYDLSTNTWAGGMIDARTFQRNQGKYTFVLSEQNRCIIDSVGMDFNENGVIEDHEILPVYITAYKYGDDNNSRGFGPLYPNPMNYKYYSHAVYLSGQNIAPVGYSSGPQKTYEIDISPTVLTAGVSPESAFQGQPLTITVKKSNGSPVDLTENGSLSTEEVAALFYDDTPFNLPDYYWVRTNLQNSSSDAANNQDLFQKKIIEYDFSGAKKGVYIFKNFVANDAGSFKLRVMNKRRSDFGSINVKVDLPTVEYQLSPSAPQGMIPGELYSVTATLKDALGNIIRGTDVHYLPYAASPKREYSPAYVGVREDESEMKWISNSVAYNMSIDVEKRQRNQAGWFGPGAIYNSPYVGLVHLMDQDNNQRVDHKDSLVDVNGQVKFLIPACGEINYGGFIGCNQLLKQAGLSDVAGGQPEDHGGSLSRRYRPDGTFHIDWFAFTQEKMIGKPLEVRAYDENKGPLPTVSFDLSNHDLISGTTNRIFLRIKEAGPGLKGFHFYENNQKIASADFETVQDYVEVEIKPSQSGEGVITVKAVYQFDSMEQSFEQSCMAFDVIGGLSVSIVEGEYLYSGQRSKVVLKVNQAYNDALKDTLLGLKGAGIEEWEPIDSDGTALFYFTPTNPGTIQILIKGSQILTNAPTITVFDSEKPPYLNIKEYPGITRNTTITLHGETQIGCSVFLGEQEVSVSSEGLFSIPVDLEEGKNTFLVRAFNPRGVKAEQEVVIWRRTKGPDIEMDPFPSSPTDDMKLLVTGKVTPAESEVYVNGLEATVDIDGAFSCSIPIQTGENEIRVKAIDSIGNTSELTLSYTYAETIVIVLTIGSKAMMIDGKSQEMDVAPFIRNGRTMVPIRAIAEAFGAEVEWKPATETVEIRLGDLFISMQIGNPVAMVGKKVTSLDSPPIIENGRTFVPLRFIAESFGAEVEWIAETRTIVIHFQK